MARKLLSDKDLLLMSQQFAIDACDIRKIMGHLETIVSESPKYVGVRISGVCLDIGMYTGYTGFGVHGKFSSPNCL